MEQKRLGLEDYIEIAFKYGTYIIIGMECLKLFMDRTKEIKNPVTQ